MSFEEYLKIRTKDGKLIPFKFTRFQKMLFEKFQKEIKEGKLPILKAYLRRF